MAIQAERLDHMLNDGCGKPDGVAPIELADIAAGKGGGFALNGDAEYDRSGYSVSGAGDVNGDGLADLIVGAPLASPNGPFSGQSYVVFGKADATPIELADIAAGQGGGFALNGDAEYDRSGYSVSGAGDVNGDGLADLIVGAPFVSPNGTYSGQSYVVFGKADATPIELADIAAGQGGFALNGAAAGDSSGDSVSGAGDVNGDGLADLIVGAELASPNGTYSGQSYVVFGKACGKAVELADIAAGKGGGFALNGGAEYDRSGYSVSGAGDVNGDGLADLIVGAPLASEFSGQSYVVFGKADATPIELADIAAGQGGGFALNGAAAGDFSGDSVSGAGDVNGDGLADLIVGAPLASPNGTYSGQSYVVFGKACGKAVELADIAAGKGGFALNGAAAGDRSGDPVSGAGDINGDGLADLIVGAPDADPNGPFSGQSYVVFGKACGKAVELADIAAGKGGFALNGAAAGDRSGYSVSGAGDVNGDDLVDLIVGAPHADPNGPFSGQSYVVFGGDFLFG